MNTCYRTLCYGTAIQKILRGSFFMQDNLDLVLVKNYSFQYMRIQTDHSTDENDNDILQPIFEQQAFGTILDAKVLPCAFQQPERSGTAPHEHVNLKAIPSYDNKMDGPEKQLAYTQNTRFGHSEIQGNDMIVAISDYGQLVFCTVVGQHSDPATTSRFECVTEITLDDCGSEYTKVNKKLAVDPWSRAIAIASYQDRIDIMILSDSMSRTQFSPVIGMGSIIEEGIIWHMEFLHTPTNSLDRIILVAIVYNDISRLCRIILFSIDASDSQKASIKVVGRLPLEFKTPLPILLLPLQCYQESFMVITERTVCVLSADDISCGNVLYPVVPISSNDFDSNTNEDILITSYSLCADPTLPYMYLGTAEGYLLKLDISDLDSMKWIACQKVNPIGQQMCVLGLIQVDDDEGELWMAEALFYVGESADSQLVAIPWNDGDSCNTSAPFVLQTLVNRAPLTDWQIVRKNGQPDRLVTCSGQDEQGALHYISRDVDSTTLYASDVNWNGITKMWCLSNSLGRCHLVASSSYSTRVALLDYEDRMDEDTTEIVETQVPSIYAGSFKVHLHGTVVIQITQDGTTLLDVDGVLLLRCPNSSGFTTVIGTSWLTDNILYIFTCISNGEKHSLQIVTVSFVGGFSNIATTLNFLTTLDHLPSCIYYFTMMDQADGKSHPIVAIGAYDAKVSLYSIVTEDLINLRQKIDCQDIPHSLATIKTSGQLHLLIGTRAGNLATINLLSAFDQYSNQVITADKYWVQSLGSSPVVLSISQNDDLAFALCECIWLLYYDCNSRLMMEAIYKQKATNIEALLSLDLSSDKQRSSDCQKLAIVADQRLHIIQVKRKPKMMTRKHILATTPRKLLLHDHSTSYLVTSSKHRGKTYHQLLLLDQNGELLCEHRFAYGETVLSLSKWQVQNKKKVYHYICVGIEHQDKTQNHSNGSPHDTPHGNGSLHLYRLKAQRAVGKDSHIQYSIRLVWKNEGLSGGVHTICPHPSGLLFSSGSTLHLHHLDMAQGALVEITHKVLRFPITSIHVIGDRICVTGHVESVSFYSYDKETMHLSFLKSDSISRNVHHSLLLNNRTVVGVSLSGGVFALKEPVADPSYDGDSLQTLFCFHYPDIIINPHCMSLHSYHSTEYTCGILAKHLIPWTTSDESHANIEHDDAAPTLTTEYTISNEKHILQQKPQPQRNKVTTQPIIGCTISGGVIAVYQCSGTLFTLLDSLQRKLLLYAPTQPLLGSSSRYSQWYTHLSGPEVSTIHCDFISLFIRLTSGQQRQIVRLADNTTEGRVSGEDAKDIDSGTEGGAIASENSDLDRNGSDNKGKANSSVRPGSLIDLTLEMVEKDDHRSFHTIPDWTPPPDHDNYENLVSWTARTLVLLVTNLEQYYF